MCVESQFTFHSQVFFVFVPCTIFYFLECSAVRIVTVGSYELLLYNPVMFTYHVLHCFLLKVCPVEECSAYNLNHIVTVGKQQLLLYKFVFRYSERLFPYIKYNVIVMFT